MYFYKLRETFFNFFEHRGHKIIKSSSLTPDDPSVLLTTAGMQQFKKYYMGKLNPISDLGTSRAVSIQKCFRTSDIDEVGDETHLTFFEMMGNFSFSPIGNDNPSNIDNKFGYFKKSAIVWAWEFVTKVLKIYPDNIFVTIFGGDEQIEGDKKSFEIWKDIIGLPESRILKRGREDNFWGPTGNEGPCGPTTEIYIVKNKEDAINGNGVEIWNVVFNEYYAKLDENRRFIYNKTNIPGIDTGMGFERLLTVVENKNNIFQTSSFSKIMDMIDSKTKDLDVRSKRILADHIRGIIFLIGDGILPSNKEVGYVLRRLMRIVMGISIKNDIDLDIFEDVYDVVSEQYGKIYEEIKKKKEILNIWNNEVGKFSGVISKGLNKLKKIKSVSGKEAFYLYETFGLPLELIKEFSKDIKFSKNIDNEFENEFKKHQEISKSGSEKKFGGHGLALYTGELKASDNKEIKRVIRMHTATHLLQWSLRKLFGDSIKQMGSDINAKRLRFDFSFDRKLTDEEKTKVEDLVNKKIKEDLPVYYKEMKKEEAEKVGALSFFKEKYPDIIKVYFIGDDSTGGVVSKEFCGGPHVERTGEIGKFKILKEESVGMGIRRIKATVK